MQEIICILDCSGSMYSARDAAVSGFNEFLKTQQEVGEANLTIVWFHSNWVVGYEGKLSEAKPLTQWKDGGMTALYDAIGKTFNYVNPRFSKEKPEKVILAIQTDGLENVSTEFSLDNVKHLIEKHEDQFGWDVIYLGAGLEAKRQAENLGIKADKIGTYNTRDTEKAFGEFYSQSVTRARS